MDPSSHHACPFQRTLNARCDCCREVAAVCLTHPHEGARYCESCSIKMGIFASGIDPERPGCFDPGTYCYLCKVELSSSHSYKQHMNSKRHLSALRKVRTGTAVIDETYQNLFDAALRSPELTRHLAPEEIAALPQFEAAFPAAFLRDQARLLRGPLPHLTGMECYSMLHTLEQFEALVAEEELALASGAFVDESSPSSLLPVGADDVAVDDEQQFDADEYGCAAPAGAAAAVNPNLPPHLLIQQQQQQQQRPPAQRPFALRDLEFIKVVSPSTMTQDDREMLRRDLASNYVFGFDTEVATTSFPQVRHQLGSAPNILQIATAERCWIFRMSETTTLAEATRELHSGFKPGPPPPHTVSIVRSMFRAPAAQTAAAAPYGQHDFHPPPPPPPAPRVEQRVTGTWHAVQPPPGMHDSLQERCAPPQRPHKRAPTAPPPPPPPLVQSDAATFAAAVSDSFLGFDYAASSAAASTAPPAAAEAVPQAQATDAAVGTNIKIFTPKRKHPHAQLPPAVAAAPPPPLPPLPAPPTAPSLKAKTTTTLLPLSDVEKRKLDEQQQQQQAALPKALMLIPPRPAACTALLVTTQTLLAPPQSPFSRSSSGAPPLLYKRLFGNGLPAPYPELKELLFGDSRKLLVGFAVSRDRAVINSLFFPESSTGPSHQHQHPHHRYVASSIRSPVLDLGAIFMSTSQHHHHLHHPQQQQQPQHQQHAAFGFFTAAPPIRSALLLSPLRGETAPVGLRQACARLYARQVAKPKGVSCSNWARPLHRLQILYAARDAVLSRMCFMELQRQQQQQQMQHQNTQRDYFARSNRPGSRML